MILQCHHNLELQGAVKATEVVVFTEAGAPVAVISDLGDNVIQVTTAADGEAFTRIVQTVTGNAPPKVVAQPLS